MLERLKNTGLPIIAQLDAIRRLLQERSNLVLQADPGAGKTTIVPLAILDLIPAKQKILLLEPRRLAARNAAARMAELLDEPVGKSVGYRIRNEVKVSSATRIEVITEGILTRMLQSDAEIADVGAIIFDEFHERSLDGDLGLALAFEVQLSLRDDLKLLVMSATLNTAAVARLLKGAPTLISEGRCYPVSTHYVAPQAHADWSSIFPTVIAQHCSHQSEFKPGQDILVFLPGISEIKRAAKMLQPLQNTHSVEVILLYGDLPLSEQRRALLPIKGKQKIILSTNIAETSVTIEGVNCVVDCGLVRQSEFDPNAGFNRLFTRRISSASSTQRTGRAGRLGPGTCYRLWNESEALRAETTAEILRADLTSFALELAQWGAGDPLNLRLLDQPNSGMFAQAQELLRVLNALDSENKITQHGQQLLALGVHPRLAHMLVESIAMGATSLACLLAAMLEEKDCLPAGQRTTNDFMTRVNFQLANSSRSYPGKQIDQQKSRLLAKLKSHPQSGAYQQLSIENSRQYTATLLALAFPDRVARRRGQGYRLANGTGALIADESDLSAEFLVVTQLGGQGTTAKIFQAIAIDLQEIETLFAYQIIEKEVVDWDVQRESVKGERLRMLGELVLASKPVAKIDEQLLLSGMVKGVKKKGIDSLPWSPQLRQWQARITLLRSVPQYAELFPNVSDQYLSDNMQQWLVPYLHGIKKLSQITSEILSQALLSQLDWALQQQLDQLMPLHLTVASGSKVPLDYTDKQKPVLAVKLQEMFGEKQTPRLANGQLSVVVHLLSPARRLLQITEDLASFWASGYVEVKKEMKGRYPKHPWPDDPLTAQATHLTKKRLMDKN